MSRFPRSNIKSGPFAGHIQIGKRRFVTPLIHSGIFNQVDWRRTDLPDLLWPILIAHLNGNGAIRGFVNWQKELIEALELDNETNGSIEYLDGRLSGLELLANDSLDRQNIIRDTAAKHGLLPVELRRLLLAYPEFPCRWLFEPSQSGETQNTDLTNLYDAVIGVLSNAHRESLIKCISIWGAVQGGTFSAEKPFLDALIDYPININKRDYTDSLVRSSWAPRQKVIELQLTERKNLTTQWSQEFWSINSRILPCFRHQELAQYQSTDLDSSLPSETQTSNQNNMNDSQPDTDRYQLVLELLETFIESLELSGFEQQSREKYEVNAGLIIRAGRELLAVLESPVLWTSEYGSHVTRMLVETQIYVTWMSAQADDIYRQYQEYGFGKAKLHARMLEQTPKEHLTDEILKSIEELKKLSRNSEILDIRTIDTRDSFAEGKSIRKMADESGLLDLYTMVYGVASGVTHSEWWSIEQNSMEQCLNVLHGGHLIPSLSLHSGGDSRLADHWIMMFSTMLHDVVQILGLSWESDSPADII